MSLFTTGNTSYSTQQFSDCPIQIACNIQPLQNTGVLNQIDSDVKSEKRLDWARHWIEAGFDALEKQLAETSGKYCVGNNVTLVDACLVPQVQNARRYGIVLYRVRSIHIDFRHIVDLAKYPIIERIDAALSELPEFKKAHARRQPDTPEAERLP